MKLLIFSAATGGGHDQAARAIGEYFGENGYEVQILDGLKEANKLVGSVIVNSYRFMARHTPAVFGGLYKWSGDDTGISRLLKSLNSSMGRQLLSVINVEQPDLIITTHPFITDMISSIKKRGLISAPIICVMTDYGPHAAWLASHVDAFITATEDMTAPIVELGVPENKIHPYGIPVRKSFFMDFDRAEIYKELGFSEEKPTVLLMAGSFGVKAAIDFCEALIKSADNMQLIVITGNNESLRESFQRLLSGCSITYKLLGFTTEVHKYMQAADLLITKPGGLTVSEALASNLPLAVFDAIPGQEEDNADFLARHCMGVKLGKESCNAKIVAELANDAERLAQMKAACAAFDSNGTLPKMKALADEIISRGESI